MTGQNSDNHYEDIIEAFGEDTIENRFAFLFYNAKKFIKDKSVEEFVNIDATTLQLAVIDYFADIKRLKDFHQIERANRTKVAAYTAYWVSRRKPLSVIKHPENSDKSNFLFLRNINEWFSVTLLFAMNYDCSKPLIEDGVRWKELNVFIKNIQYFLVYRVVTAPAIELSLVALEATPVHEPLY